MNYNDDEKIITNGVSRGVSIVQAFPPPPPEEGEAAAL
jgi:hypothetical protein